MFLAVIRLGLRLARNLYNHFCFDRVDLEPAVGNFKRHLREVLALVIRELVSGQTHRVGACISSLCFRGAAEREVICRVQRVADFGIHALVGQDADIRRRRAVFGIVGKAAARADLQALAVDLVGLGQRFDDKRLLFPALRVGQVGAVDDGELVPADAERAVAAADAGLQALGNGLEQLVAHVVPIRVVDGLEEIQIEVIQRERHLLLFQIGEHAAEIPLVVQAGQAVRVRQILQFDLLADVLPDHHHLRQQAVAVKHDGNNVQQRIDVFLPDAVFEFEDVRLLAQHAAQILRLEDLIHLHPLRLAEHQIPAAHQLDKIAVAPRFGIEQLGEHVFAILVSVAHEVADGVAIRNPPHAGEQPVGDLLLPGEHLLFHLQRFSLGLHVGQNQPRNAQHRQ